jgi:hypothetical protein
MTQTEEMKKLAELVGIPPFEADNEKCDCCPARATHRVGFTTGYLDFCTHHFNEKEPELVFKSTDMLIRAVESNEKESK